MCKSVSLASVIDLGDMALTGRFPDANESDPPTAPLDLIRCEDCGLVQLRHSVDIEEMFGASYGYRSGINTTMSAHLRTITQAVSAYVDLRADETVLDIGCNDGTLLKTYQIDGLKRIGIDPSSGNFTEHFTDELNIHAEFFSADIFRRVAGTQKPRVVTSIAMFYDLEDPATFVSDVAAILAEDGIWVLEQSYLPSMLETNSFDTICHEHLEYYAMAQIQRLTSDNNLRILDVKLNAVNGGSFQIWVCHEAASYVSNDANINELSQIEENLGLLTDVQFSAFRARVQQNAQELHEFISQQVNTGKKVYVYGASTKGNVLLQYLGLNQSFISGCAERNPFKYGRRTPGTNIPIVSEEEARANADYFLVLPWHFREEFLARETEFMDSGGKFIFPLPKFDVVGC